MNRIPRGLVAAALAAVSTLALAQTSVKDAWVRGTVAQQTSTGAFMQITSAHGGKLVGASSPLAGIVEVHAMAMHGGVMRMHAAPALDLPAGKTVALEPGGYHVMMMELKQPLKAGDVVPLTLVVEGNDGKRETIEVKAPVRPLGEAKHGH